MILGKNLSDTEKADRLCIELERLKTERGAFEATWQEAQSLVASTVLSFPSNEGDSHSGFDVPARITNRPANYHETLVSGICGYAVNPNITWMKLGLSDQEAMKGYGVKDWLEEVEQAEYEEFDNSNMYTEQKVVIDQATIFGYGIMLIDEDELNRQVRYRQIDVTEAYLDTNEHNEYETVFRRFFMSTENAASHWGLEAMHEGVRSAWIADEASGAQKARELELLHAVFRRKDAKGGSQRSADMPFASFFIDIANKHVIEESGYRSFPYAIFAWDRVGGKKYPLSPAIKAMNDVRLLHKSEETRLTLAQMAAKQPIAMPESMRNVTEVFGKDGYIRPGAIIYYDHEAGDQVPGGINMGSNYPITLDITKQQADNIKDWFYVDFFLMLQHQNISQMTATAVQALQGEKAAVMTNMIVNLKRALGVVVQRTYDIMAAQGRLPQLPLALLAPEGGKGNRMKFTFSSVLSQIQQAALRYQGAAKFLPAAHSVATLGQAYPPALEALDRFDFDVILQNEARAAHMPETAIREDDDVEAIKERRQRAAMAQQLADRQQQQAQAAAQNYSKLNERPEPGSPAEALFAQQGAW